MIEPTDLTGVEETLARRILVHARTIAPCLDSLIDGEEGEPKPKSDAIAILLGVAREVPAVGSRRVKSQRIGPAQVEYFDVPSAFSDDDRNSLRSLCSVASSGGLPIGSFPRPARVVDAMWPECYDT